MKKNIYVIIMIMVMILPIVGCSSVQPSGGSEPAISQMPEIQIEEADSGTVSIEHAWPFYYVRIYHPDRGEYFNFGMNCTLTHVTPDVVMLMVLRELELDIVYRSVSVQNGKVCVHWSNAFAERMREDPDLEATVLNSVAINLQDFGDVYYYVEQEPYPLPGVTSGAYSPVKATETAYVYDMTQEEFIALRLKIPYPGLPKKRMIEIALPIMDEHAIQINTYIQYLEDPDVEFDSPKELDNAFILRCALLAVPLLTDREQEPYGQTSPYRKQMRYFSTMENYDYKIKEHVEQAAKQLFGVDAEVIHGNGTFAQYSEKAGVYSYPPTTGPGSSFPIITSYKDLGDSYRVEVAYFYVSPFDYSFKDKYYDMDGPELQSALRDAKPERVIVLDKLPGGGLVIRSHHYL